jgi:RPA family protein
MAEIKKRELAHKIRISDLLLGNQIFEDLPDNVKRFKFLELGNKNIIRVNLIANVIDKYQSDGERRFASITLDDGSAQIRVRVFGDDINSFDEINQGDCVVVIGILRSYNLEIYVLPEIIKKVDPKYLLVRKLEIENEYPKINLPEEKKEIKMLRDDIIRMIKVSEPKEGIDKEDIIMSISSNPKIVSEEIQKLLEEGIIYEPRPGRVRYLG